MTAADELDLDAEACGVGFRHADDDEWSVRERRARHDEYFRAMAALQRRERRERLARAIAVVKTAQKAGLPVKRATIEGVDLEFGQPEAAKAPATLTPLEAWKAKHARHA
jgi:hypothetical protein